MVPQCACGMPAAWKTQKTGHGKLYVVRNGGPTRLPDAQQQAIAVGYNK